MTTVFLIDETFAFNNVEVWLQNVVVEGGMSS